MLVLSRRTNESLILCDRNTLRLIAKITITDVQGDRVRLGTSAGPEIGIHREEVYLEILEEEGGPLDG